MSKITWKTESRKISELKEHPHNPRQITKDQLSQLKKSLDKFGYAEIIAINTDNTIVAGHQRIHAMQDLGMDQTIEVRVPSRLLTKEEEGEYLIRSNRNTGEWDFDLLANNWDPIDLIEYGFNPEDFDIDIPTPGDEGEDESDELEPGEDKDAITKLGDVYELNNHRLVCGDSTNKEYVDKCLNGNTPILMVTDPPYGVEYDPKWRDVAGKGCRAKGKVQNDSQIDWTLAWNLFTGSIAYVWHAGKYCAEVQKSLEECNFEMISQIIWVKQHFALSRGDYHWQHEPCWYAVKKGSQHNWQGSRKEATTWEIANLNCFGKSKEDGEERTAHSTQKPVECMARPIRNNTAEGEQVYDPFLGSGTTIIAAESLNRICYGLELSPAYCDIIVNRWKNYMIKNDKKFIIKKNGDLIE